MPITPEAALKLAKLILDPLNEGLSELTQKLAATMIVKAVERDEKEIEELSV